MEINITEIYENARNEAEEVLSRLDETTPPSVHYRTVRVLRSVERNARVCKEDWETLMRFHYLWNSVRIWEKRINEHLNLY